MGNRYRSMMLVMLLCLWATSANALSCFDPSPTGKNGQDPYRPIKVRELTREETEYLRTAFRALDGEWQGTGSEQICTGRADSPEQKIIQYTLKARLTTNYSGSFTLTVDSHGIETGVSGIDTLRIYLTEKELRAGDSTGAGQVELMKVSPDAVSFRQRVVSGGLQRESFTTIRMTANTLSVDRTYYAQAQFIGRKSWRLQKVKY